MPAQVAIDAVPVHGIPCGSAGIGRALGGVCARLELCCLDSGTARERGGVSARFEGRVGGCLSNLPSPADASAPLLSLLLAIDDLLTLARYSESSK